MWDFCRAVDDAVDEIVPESEWKGGLTAEARTRAAAALASWRDEIARCYGPESPQTPQGRVLKPFVAECHLPRAQFETLVEILRDAVQSWKDDGTAMIVLLSGAKSPKGVPKLKAGAEED